MGFALQYRQAIEMWVNAADQQGITRPKQMLRGDGGTYVARSGSNEIGSLLGGYVLEHDLERWKVAHDASKQPIDENALPVEHIDIGVGDFAMDQQRQSTVLHGSKRRISTSKIGHTGSRMGGRACGIVFDADDETRRLRARNFIGRGIVGQIERH